MREPCFIPDMSAELDTPAEILGEELEIDVPTAEKVLAWHEEENRRRTKRQEVDRVCVIVGVLCRPCKNGKARMASLQLALRINDCNGLHSQSELARELGCSRALISHYVTMWSDLLGIDVTAFRKSPGTRRTYADSARSSLQTRKQTMITPCKQN
jgi:biotin operon repressor